MAKRKKLTVRRATACLMLTVLLASLLTWYFTLETLPGRIRIGAGSTGGLYHDFAWRIKELLEARFPMKVEVLETSGSSNNRERLLARDGPDRVDLAVLQDGQSP